MFEDVPAQLEHTAYHAYHDLSSGGRDVDDTAYRHMPRFAENSVRMVTRVRDRASLIGARSLPLRPIELRNRHPGDPHPRRALAVEGQPLRNGRGGVDDAATHERAAIVDHRDRLAAVVEVADPDPGAERQGLVG